MTATETTPFTHPALSVRALQPSRWRAGRAFTSEATLIEANSLGAEAHQAILADPLLVVTAASGADDDEGGETQPTSPQQAPATAKGGKAKGKAAAQ